MNEVALLVFGLATVHAAAYLISRATVWDDLKAWLGEGVITARDFVEAAATCPICSSWWVLLITQAAFLDRNVLRLVGTWGLFILVNDAARPVKVDPSLKEVWAVFLFFVTVWSALWLANGTLAVSGVEVDRLVVTVAAFIVERVVAHSVFRGEDVVA